MQIKHLKDLGTHIGNYSTTASYVKKILMSKPKESIKDCFDRTNPNKVVDPYEKARLIAERKACVHQWWIYAISHVIIKNEREGKHEINKKKDI